MKRQRSNKVVVAAPAPIPTVNTNLKGCPKNIEGGQDQEYYQVVGVEHQTSKAAAAAATAVKRKARKEVEEEEQEGGGGEPSEAATAAESVVGAEEWEWMRGGVVDEQMSWGYISLPIWDVELKGKAHSELYSDDSWDDDIWGLKSIKEIPNQQ